MQDLQKISCGDSVAALLLDFASVVLPSAISEANAAILGWSIAVLEGAYASSLFLQSLVLFSGRKRSPSARAVARTPSTMASTSVLVELVCGELGIDASKPMVERVQAAARMVGIDFVSVRATTEALAAQLLPVTQEEDSSDDDVVLTHVETPRSKAAASLAEAVRTGAVVQIDDSEQRRPPAWYDRSKHLSARKLVVSLIESRLRTLARGGWTSKIRIRSKPSPVLHRSSETSRPSSLANTTSARPVSTVESQRFECVREM